MLDPIELGRPPVTAYSTARKAPIGKHAIALGASMAGLLAARVLGDFYTTVTVVERGTLGDTAAVRKGGYRRAGIPMGCSCGARKHWRSYFLASSIS